MYVAHPAPVHPHLWPLRAIGRNERAIAALGPAAAFHAEPRLSDR